MTLTQDNVWVIVFHKNAKRNAMVANVILRAMYAYVPDTQSTVFH